MKKAEVTEYNFSFEDIQKEDWGLKPCPFCGNEKMCYGMMHPQFAGKPDMDYWLAWFIDCPECGAYMENGKLTGQTWEEAKKEIIESWNKRPDNSNPLWNEEES